MLSPMSSCSPFPIPPQPPSLSTHPPTHLCSSRTRACMQHSSHTARSCPDQPSVPHCPAPVPAFHSPHTCTAAGPGVMFHLPHPLTPAPPLCCLILPCPPDPVPALHTLHTCTSAGPGHGAPSPTPSRSTPPAPAASSQEEGCPETDCEGLK